jgi:RHS repeat-associated protein
VTETKVISGTGGGSFKTQWSYNPRDLVATQVYPGGNGGQAGETVRTSYDKWGRPGILTGTNNYVVGTDYTALGQLDLLKLGNTAASPSLQTDYVYFGGNGNFRLQWIKTGPTSPFEGLQKLEYSYDALGNVLSIKDYKAGGTQTQSFAYDALDRVISATASGGSGGVYSEAYTFNAIGNLISKGGVNYTYGSSKPHAVTAAGSNSYAYDANGNMTGRVNVSGTYTLTYDAENRMKQVSGAASASFGYDGDGRLVTATVGSTTTCYIGNYYEQTGSTIRKYYYHAGKRVAMRDGSTLYWLLTDHLGSTAIAATSTGVLSGELRYKAWGETRYTTGTVASKYRFTGQREESTIGLYFYNARWYDAALGRFVQADTVVPEVGNPQALNRYSYVLNNPLRYTDPTGRYIFENEPDDPFFRRPQDGLPSMRSWTMPDPRNIEPFLLEEIGANTTAPQTTAMKGLNWAAPYVAFSPGGRTPAALMKGAAYVLWMERVFKGRPCDYKDYIREKYGSLVRVGSRQFPFDIVANVNYGYIGRVAGFSAIELKVGAGAAQVVDNVVTPMLKGTAPSWQNIGPPATFFDDPRDQAAIQIGIELYDRYRLDVSLSEFYRVFYRYASQLVLPPEDSAIR